MSFGILQTIRSTKIEEGCDDRNDFTKTTSNLFFSPLSLKVMQKDLCVVLFTILMHSEAVAQWLPNVKFRTYGFNMP